MKKMMPWFLGFLIGIGNGVGFMVISEVYFSRGYEYATNDFNLTMQFINDTLAANCGELEQEYEALREQLEGI